MKSGDWIPKIFVLKDFYFLKKYGMFKMKYLVWNIFGGGNTSPLNYWIFSKQKFVEIFNFVSDLFEYLMGDRIRSLNLAD